MSEKHFIKAFSKCCDAEVVYLGKYRWACTWCTTEFSLDEREEKIEWVRFVKKVKVNE